VAVLGTKSGAGRPKHHQYAKRRVTMEARERPASAYLASTLPKFLLKTCTSDPRFRNSRNSNLRQPNQQETTGCCRRESDGAGLSSPGRRNASGEIGRGSMGNRPPECWDFRKGTLTPSRRSRDNSTDFALFGVRDHTR
jgi:hypothetical protein